MYHFAYTDDDNGAPLPSEHWSETYWCILVSDIFFTMCIMYDIILSYSNPGYLYPQDPSIEDSESESSYLAPTASDPKKKIFQHENL